MFTGRKTPQGGFTLIELVVVIVIIGILAAFAIPRFANISRDARISALNGMAGTLRSSAALVHGMALARNVINDNTGLVSLEGQPISVVNGYPEASAAGIIAALVSPPDTNTYTVQYGVPAAGSVTIQMNGASNMATCQVTYTQPAAVGLAGQVAPPLTAGC